MVNLDIFCGEEGDKRTGKPWSFGDFTLATNGHVLIRVPRREGVAENEDAPKVFDGRMAQAFINEPMAWVAPPEVTVKPKPCLKCGSSGKMSVCPECEGEGVVDFCNSYNSYSIECKTCEGEEQVDAIDGEEVKCSACNGRGKVWEDKSVTINGVNLSDRYISWIRELPNAEIGVIEELKPARFRFEGGDGLIMPRRGQD